MQYLGVDFGLKRVGLATSEGDLASPFKTIEVKGFKDAVEKVTELSRKMDVRKIVVGLPEGQMGQTVLGFINALKKRGLDVLAADETLSTHQAISKMIALNIPLKKRRVSDDMAAAIILQNFLDKR